MCFKITFLLKTENFDRLSCSQKSRDDICANIVKKFPIEFGKFKLRGLANIFDLKYFENTFLKYNAMNGFDSLKAVKTRASEIILTCTLRSDTIFGN